MEPGFNSLHLMASKTLLCERTAETQEQFTVSCENLAIFSSPPLVQPDCIMWRMHNVNVPCMTSVLCRQTKRTLSITIILSLSLSTHSQADYSNNSSTFPWQQHCAGASLAPGETHFQQQLCCTQATRPPVEAQLATQKVLLSPSILAQWSYYIIERRVNYVWDKWCELLLHSHPNKASQLGKNRFPLIKADYLHPPAGNRAERLSLHPLTGCDIWSHRWWLSADSSQQELRKRPRESSAEKGQLNWTFSSNVASKRREEKRRE